MDKIPTSCYAWEDGPEDEVEDKEFDWEPDPDLKRDEEIESDGEDRDWS